MLYRPLFWTSYWYEDWLSCSQYRGATKILISSASSKTAFCVAYLIRKRIVKGELSGIKVIGLTSKKNLAFTKGLSLYDDVINYDSFTSAPSLSITQGGDKWLYTDVAGNDQLNERVFHHFGSHLVTSIALGLTNLSPSSSSPSSPSINWSTNTFTNDHPPSSPATLQQFFMPEWLAKRRSQLSVAHITRMQNLAWEELMNDCKGWVEMHRVFGAENVKAAYEDVVKDGLGPERGLIWSLWDMDKGNDNMLSKL